MTRVVVPFYPGGGKGLDLERINAAMDIVLAHGNEGSARYALMHTDGWSPLDAVEYVRAAVHCFDNGIDPNQCPPVPG